MVWDGVTWFMKHSFDTIWLCINQRYCKQTIRQGCLFLFKLSYFPTEFSSNPAPIQMFVIILKSSWRSRFSGSQVGFTFTHLADAFIQSDSQYIQAIFFFLSVCVFPGNWTHILCAANAMLYHWATGTGLWCDLICGARLAFLRCAALSSRV